MKPVPPRNRISSFSLAGSTTALAPAADAPRRAAPAPINSLRVVMWSILVL
jgi:hypothetical protein